ncbi:MAG: hypothetical protein JSR15_04030 [Proteobacteria bacterium]|nr:hypothetical protein [Pseudomonadota bacterium]
MNIIDQYLHHVRAQLPQRNRDDVLAELREAIGNRQEERSAELGRALNDAELEQMLQDFGHPLAIAARYRSTPHLIGPEWFPIYLFVLKRVLPVAAVVTFVVGAVLRVAWGAVPVQAFLGATGATATVVLAFVGALTIVFGLIERRVPAPFGAFRWRASRTKPVEVRPLTGRLGNALAALLCALMALWWWTSAPPHTLLPTKWTGGLALSWGAFYASFGYAWLMVFFAQALMHALAACNALSARALSLVRATLLAASAVLAIMILRSDAPFIITQGAVAASDEQLTLIFSGGFRLALAIAVVASLIQAVVGYLHALRPMPRTWD